jgi:heterodisulfide reductase subunit A2
VEAGRSPNIEIITKAELLAVDGEAGNFRVKLRKQPRYVDEALCTACGTCTGYCPAPAADSYNGGLCTTKALHIDYQQAIPAAFHVDPDACLFLTRQECKQCERVCHTRAIDFNQQAREIELDVGAVILAPGFGRISKQVLSQYGYTIYPDVITGMEFERMTSATGPTTGELLRPSDRTHPKRIAFLQCIGSRDSANGNGYCSSVCCMYAVKEALVAKEHEPELDISIFYMDMRTQGKEFDSARLRAEEKGIRFIRSRVGEVRSAGNHLELAYADSEGRHRKESFDMVVLPEGLESPEGARELARAAQVGLNQYDFCNTGPFTPLKTSREGIFVAGAFQGPKDVPESVTDASGAVALAAGLLKEARGSLVRRKSYPDEVEIGEEPRIGVFVCACGTNIGGVIDVKSVAESAASLDNVLFTDVNLYSCAQNTQAAITEKIRVNRLNRVVVAACTPRTHEPLFQETLRNAGLNRCLFEMANIRDHCSWVHALDPEEATKKARDLVRMAVAKAGNLDPLPGQTVPVTPRALIIGGGIAGMKAALSIAGQGFESCLVEKTPRLGGSAGRLRFTLSGSDPRELLRTLETEVRENPRIAVFTNAHVESVSGYVGNFSSVIRNGEGAAVTVEHGVIVAATGGVENVPDRYLYGKSPRVLTQTEFEELLERPGEARSLRSIVMIQCAGSRGDDLAYCSKVCCGQAVKNALKLLEGNPSASVVVLYRDMRTYGFAEDYYQEARARGVVFIPFEQSRPPVVSSENGAVGVRFFDRLLGEEVVLEPDRVVLSTGIRPSPVEDLAKMLKAPLTRDGFFLEAHPKLRPVECSVSGVYLCGVAHSPKPIPEAIAQAEAAAGKACTLLAAGSVSVEPTVAKVDASRCIGCGICETLCPYAAITLIREDKRKKAHSIPASCKGCGICASHCPALCIEMGGFTFDQILSQIRAFSTH